MSTGSILSSRKDLTMLLKVVYILSNAPTISKNAPNARFFFARLRSMRSTNLCNPGSVDKRESERVFPQYSEFCLNEIKSNFPAVLVRMTLRSINSVLNLNSKSSLVLGGNTNSFSPGLGHVTIP